MENIRERIGDPDTIRLLEQMVSAPGHAYRSGPLGRVLANSACQEIDQILRQVNRIGRRDKVAHVTCARFDQDVVVLLDHDAEFEWLLPALQKRLREALSGVDEEIDPTKTQLVDLAKGKPLQILGFELRTTKDAKGSVRVQYKCLEEKQRAPARRSIGVGFLRRPVSSLKAALRLLSRLRLQQAAQLLRDGWRNASAFKFGWRHLPITLCPMLAIMFGLSSPFTLLCVLLSIGLNVRATIQLLLNAGRKAPQYWLELAAATCLIFALYLSAPLISDFYKKHSREDPVPKMPPGFFMGQYNPSWDGEPIPYGLYFPPHLLKERGPYPLVVFLHGSGEASKELIFTVGVPQTIAINLGEHLNKGKFDFVAFFPIMERRKGTKEFDLMEDGMKTLDYVIRRHHIDPARIYLTGLSLGGWRAWQWVEQYPDKWAAIAPVSSVPRIPQKVPRLPMWIFQGGKDGSPSPAQSRELVQKWKEARVEAQYTEVPNKGHEIWWDAYGPRDLYDWFAKHRRE